MCRFPDFTRQLRYFALSRKASIACKSVQVQKNDGSTSRYRKNVRSLSFVQKKKQTKKKRIRAERLEKRITDKQKQQ